MQNFMFQLQLYQLKIMQNYYNNWDRVLKEQLTGINIYLFLVEFPWISSFQGVNRRFSITFEEDAPQRRHTGYFFSESRNK